MGNQTGCARTQLTWQWGDTSVLTIAPAEGELGLIPERRSWRIGQRGIENTEQVQAWIGTQACDPEIEYDSGCNTLWVGLQAPVTVQGLSTGKGHFWQNHGKNWKTFRTVRHIDWNNIQKTSMFLW